MKNLYKHIITGFMLALVLLYSTPVKSLHDCKNLHQHDNHLAFNESHEDCPICDLQYAPFMPVPGISIEEFPVYSLQIHTSLPGDHNHVYCNCYLNKGPPVLG